MKKLLLLAALFSSTAFGYVTGDKILFQKDSTYVSAAFSKSLCLNGETYEAMIRKCFEWRTSDDDRRCVDWRKVKAFQPMHSTRQRCATFGGGDDDRCTSWVTVPFYQSPERTVTYYNNNDDNDIVKVEEITIPNCN